MISEYNTTTTTPTTTRESIMDKKFLDTLESYLSVWMSIDNRRLLNKSWITAEMVAALHDLDADWADEIDDVMSSDYPAEWDIHNGTHNEEEEDEDDEDDVSACAFNCPHGACDVDLEETEQQAAEWKELVFVYETHFYCDKMKSYYEDCMERHLKDVLEEGQVYHDLFSAGKAKLITKILKRNEYDYGYETLSDGVIKNNDTLDYEEGIQLYINEMRAAL